MYSLDNAMYHYYYYSQLENAIALQINYIMCLQLIKMLYFYA